MRWLVLVALGCGRIAFDPLSGDGDGGPGSGDGAAATCGMHASCQVSAIQAAWRIDYDNIAVDLD